MSKKQRSEQEFIKETIDGYLDANDWRVQENSNVGFSIGGLILHSSGAMSANYWLNEVYPENIKEAHKNATMHIHDLSMLAPYCAGWSLKQLIMEGLGGVPDKITSAPARHLNTLMQQMVNFLGITQNEWVGAQAFSSFDTFTAPFVKKDNLTDKEIRQCMQTFVYGINTPSRWGGQAPFSNITLDWVCPNDLKNIQAIVGGAEQDFTYGDCQDEMDRVNRIFMEVMLEGDANGRGFQYPIPTYNITNEFDWNHPNAELLFSMTAKYGTPYFANFVSSDMKPDDVRSMCCRLRLDKRELRKRGGGLFGSDEFTGSIGVVTINLPQLAYLAKQETLDKPEATQWLFKEKISATMELAKESLEIKRKKLTEWFEQGMYPYTKRYLRNFNNHFNTIGLVGMNEACLNLIGVDLTTTEGSDLAEKVLLFMRDKLLAFQEETGNLYNLEATPAESTSYRLAMHDKKNYPDIITSGDAEPYYTNSTQLPVDFTSDLIDALDRQESLQTKYTGGTVFHVMLGERIPSWESCRELVKMICVNYKIPYISISPVYSICSEHGYLDGEQEKCPKCGKETEVYARIVGYYRAVRNWNKGKKEEKKHRLDFITK
jgi:ribonucleoside-triphosphate reductase (formate)